MTVKEHYDQHLGFFYSWMLGDFNDKKNDFREFCKRHKIYPKESKVAIDLGAGNGIQSVALAELGFKVIAIDFNQTLLNELSARNKGLPIEVVKDDFTNLSAYQNHKPELIICCGDTLSHLVSEEEIARTIESTSNTLIPEGKIILTFRDYSVPLTDTQRFIPVKSDANRILTCYLEYFDKKVRVTDLLYEKTDGAWVQKVSSYEKVRISRNMIIDMLNHYGFDIILDDTINRMITVIAQKPITH